MPTKKTDLAQKIKALMEKGAKWAEIAKELGLSESAIRWYAKTYLSK